MPYADEDVERSSCYVMPVLVRDAERRDAIRLALRERHGVQTSIFYPAVHEFTAYRERYGAPSLPAHRARGARGDHDPAVHRTWTRPQQDRVVAALARTLV